jgi:general secretion pathway protein H
MTDRRADSQAGFTLVEILVVLAITAIVFGISAFSLSVLKGRVSPSHSGEEIAALLNSVSRQAVATSKQRVATIELKQKVFRADTGETSVQVPPDFRLTVTIGQETVTSEDRLQIYFLPDGTCSGADIKISDPKGRATSLRTNWLTGITGEVSDG